MIKRQQPNHAGVHALRISINADLTNEHTPTTYEGSLADVKRALELDPEEPRARLARGIIATRKGEFGAAITDLSWLINKKVERLGALSYRGLAYLRKGEFERALSDFTEATRSCESMVAFARSGATGSPGMSRTLRYYSQDLFNRGICFARTRDFDRAIEDFTAALEYYPESVRIYVERADAYSSKGDLDHALEDADRLVRLQSKNPQWYLLRALPVPEGRDRSRASRTWIGSFRTVPSHPVAHSS